MEEIKKKVCITFWDEKEKGEVFEKEIFTEEIRYLKDYLNQFFRNSAIELIDYFTCKQSGADTKSIISETYYRNYDPEYFEEIILENLEYEDLVKKMTRWYFCSVEVEE